jgi:hypothetical protein
MDKGFISLQMEMCIKGSGMKERERDMEFINGRRVSVMKDNGGTLK